MAKTSSDCFQTCDSNSVYRLLVRLVNTQCKDLDEEVSLFNQHKIFFFSPTRFLQSPWKGFFGGEDDKRAAFGNFAGYSYSQLIGRNGENLSNLITDRNAGLQPRFASRLHGQGLTSTSSLMLSKLSPLTFLMSSTEL
jgi:hypothetical protein